MGLSIIGYGNRVRKTYINSKYLNIDYIFRRNIKNNKFTNSLSDLVNSESIFISLKRSKFLYYIFSLKKLNFKGSIFVETPSISLIKFQIFRKKIGKVWVLEEYPFLKEYLYLRKIIKKQKYQKIFIENDGFYVLYHFLAIIYFILGEKITTINKANKNFFYIRHNSITIKSNYKKTIKRKLKIYIKANGIVEKIYDTNKKNSFEKDLLFRKKFFLKYISMFNKTYFDVNDYNLINKLCFKLKLIRYFHKLKVI